jgi:glycerol-3-phosphate O-acyltransferase
LTETLLRAQ